MQIAPSTVLIVDDDTLVRAAARAMLETHGYHVTEAGDGEAALTVMASDPAAVVLLDILMPRKEGLETLIELRRNHTSTVVIAMSASLVRKRNDFLGIAMKFGADSTLRKPFTANGLLATIGNGIAHRRHAQLLAANG